MANLDGILRVRIPQPLMDELAKQANSQMLTVSAYVRLVLAQHVGLIKPPTLLIDTKTEYHPRRE